MMDPDIQREFEEQLRQMNEMLSQTNSTMAGMVKAIQTQTAAISGNVTSVKTQTEANNQLSTSTTGRTKLAEAEAQALQKTTEAKVKFKTSVDDSSTALRGFGRALTSTEEGFKKYGGAVESAGEAAFSIGKNFGILGTVLGGAVKAVTFFASEALSMHDTMIQMNRDMVSLTGVLPVTNREMATLAAEAGYAGESMGKIAKFAASLNQNILALGDTAGQGAVKFAKVAAVGNDVYEQYSKMGISQEKLTEMQTYYIKEQAQSGRSLALRTKSEEQLRKESLAYVDNMVLLSSMTGQQAEDMQREREVVKSEFEERVKVRQEELRAQAAETRGDQAEADRIRAESASRRAIIDKYTTLYGQEVGSMVGRVVRQGGFDEFTGGLAAAGVQVEDLTGQMNAATKEQLEAQKRGASAEELEQIRSNRAIKAAEAYQTAQDNFALTLGDAAQYSKELPGAFAQTAEAFGRGENAIGKTTQERYDAAKAEQVAKEKSAKENLDKDAAMRAEQETADRKFQTEWQTSMLTLAETIMPTITAATNLAADALGKFNEYLNDINKFFADFKKYSGTILTVLGVLAGATGIGLAIKMFGVLGTAGKGLASIFSGLKNAFSGAIGWLKSLMGIGGPGGPKQDANGVWRDEKGQFAKPPSGGGKLAKLATGGLRLLGKLALPLTAGMAAYDAYQGFGADPNASFGGKMANAGKGALSGMTFGLSDYITGGVTTGTEKELQEKATKTTEKQADTATKNETTTDKTIVSNEKTSTQNKNTTDQFEKSITAFDKIIAAEGTIVAAFAKMVKLFSETVTQFSDTMLNFGDTFGLTGGSSSTVGATTSGADPKDIQTATSFFTGRGYTPAQAAGIVGNLVTESKLKPNGPAGDGGKAYGIAQWHPDRQAKFKEVMKKDIRGSSLEDQLKFIDWELKHTESAAGTALANTTTAAQAASVFDKKYERSSGAAIGERMANANAIYSGNLSGTGQSSPGSDAIVQLGRTLQGEGLLISGHTEFGGMPAEGKHAKNSRHYKDLAIDINAPGGITEANNPEWAKKFNDLAVRIQNAGFAVKWNDDPAHDNHIHASIGGSEGKVVKAAKGGVFSGASSGYPATLHGTEIVAPLTMDSILMKLAKTSALSSEGGAIEKVLTGGGGSAAGNNNVDAMVKMHSELISVLSSKLDNMIDVLDDGNDTRDKIFKHSMV